MFPISSPRPNWESLHLYASVYFMVFACFRHAHFLTPSTILSHACGTSRGKFKNTLSAPHFTYTILHPCPLAAMNLSEHVRTIGRYIDTAHPPTALLPQALGKMHFSNSVFLSAFNIIQLENQAKTCKNHFLPLEFPFKKTSLTLTELKGFCLGESSS